MKTAEQIAKMFEDKDGLANIRAINKYYREHDDSNLWPVFGKFNATERAIRKARLWQQASGAVYGLEYCYLLEQLISKIVNSEEVI